MKYSAQNGTLQWRSSDGSDYGEAASITKSGKVQVFGADKLKFIRVVVDMSNLSASDQVDEITITHIEGDLYARVLAAQLLRRFSSPVAEVSFEIGLNNLDVNGEFRKVTDLVEITTDGAFEKGEDRWTRELVMLTSLRPDFKTHKASIDAIETRIYSNNYGFIAPASNTNDWDQATAAEKQYAFIGNGANQLGAALDEGFIIW